MVSVLFFFKEDLLEGEGGDGSFKEKGGEGCFLRGGGVICVFPH